MLFSEILTVLNQSDSAIVLTGHRHPDYDSVAACLLMQQFLKQCGINAQICLYGKMDAHSATVLQKQGYNPEALFSPVPKNAVLILCDCHTTTQPGKVVACADHHPVIDAPDIPVYLNRSASSAGRIVYQEAVTYGLQTNRETDFLALASVYMDTRACRSTKFQAADKPWIIETAARRSFHLPDLERDGLCLTDFTQPVDILAQNGVRAYTFGKYRIASSYVQAEKEEAVPIGELLECCKTACCSGAYDYWVFLCYIPLEKITDIYLFNRDKNAWNKTRHTGILSRGNDVIPALERMLIERKDCKAIIMQELQIDSFT